MSTRVGVDALLRPETSVLVLIDHQPVQFATLQGRDAARIVNNVIGLAKAAKAFGVPTILTTAIKERGGYLIQGLQNTFPEQKPIDRTFINTWQDQRVVDAVKVTGRKQLVLAALWTEVCLATPEIQALAEGYDLFVVTDASGGVSAETHDMAVRRLIAAGAAATTWLAVASEWQRAFACEKTGVALTDILARHGSGASTKALRHDGLHGASSPQQAPSGDRP